MTILMQIKSLQAIHGGHCPLTHLIGNENLLLAHFYNTNVRMKLESGKQPQPSRVLYIIPSKRLNDYYAPRA
jgi:hypothetical protein